MIIMHRNSVWGGKLSVPKVTRAIVQPRSQIVICAEYAFCMGTRVCPRGFVVGQEEASVVQKLERPINHAEWEDGLLLINCSRMLGNGEFWGFI